MLNSYIHRILQSIIDSMWPYTKAFSISGIKYCGKTEFCKNYCKTIFDISDSAENYKNKTQAELDVYSIFDNEFPILIDEWQTVPAIWDATKRWVDKDEEGTIFLTGSTEVSSEHKLHNGAGRITTLLLRTLTLEEVGISKKLISINDLFESKKLPNFTSTLTLNDIIDLCVKGGWPNYWQKKYDVNVCFKKNISYLESVINKKNENIDLNFSSLKLLKLVKSLARNVCRLTEITTFASDVITNDKIEISRNTVATYLDFLQRQYLIESIPAWDSNIFSKTRLRKTPKIIFCDPSIPIAALKIDSKGWIKNLNQFGFIFENFVLKELSVYIQALGGEIFHYRDNTELEIDCILTKNDTTWGAIEIKLGTNDVSKAIHNLLLLKKKVETENINNSPAFLAVIVGTGGIAQQTPEGIYIIPIEMLYSGL